jgi:hypothetical protein
VRTKGVAFCEKFTIFAPAMTPLPPCGPTFTGYATKPKRPDRLTTALLSGENDEPPDPFAFLRKEGFENLYKLDEERAKNNFPFHSKIEEMFSKVMDPDDPVADSAAKNVITSVLALCGNPIFKQLTEQEVAFAYNVVLRNALPNDCYTKVGDLEIENLSEADVFASPPFTSVKTLIKSVDRMCFFHSLIARDGRRKTLLPILESRYGIEVAGAGAVAAVFKATIDCALPLASRLNSTVCYIRPVKSPMKERAALTNICVAKFFASESFSNNPNVVGRTLAFSFIGEKLELLAKKYGQTFKSPTFRAVSLSDEGEEGSGANVKALAMSEAGTISIMKWLKTGTINETRLLTSIS